jgi:peptidoglycan/LPS O-acetylase OafA/YrhL
MMESPITAWLKLHVYTAQPRPAGHLGGLDALRFLSVYCILLSHTGFRTFSGFGVPILMALSGFLITRQLSGEFRRNGIIKPGQFLAGRVLRIAPAYLVFVGITYLADYLTDNVWPPALLWFALTHTVNYFNATHGHPDLSMAHVWTLSILEQFYLVWPVIFSVLVTSPRRLLILCAMIIIALCWRVYAYTTLLSDNIAWIYNALDCRLDSILLGCAIAVWVDQNPDSYKRLQTTPPGLILTGLLSLVFIAYSNDYKPWHYSFGYLFEAIAAMCLIVSVSRLSAYPSFRWLDSAIFSWLGKISYPLFLYHILAIGVAKKLVDDVYLQLIIATLISVITAAFSYYFIESPALRLRSRLRSSWNSARNQPS